MKKYIFAAFFSSVQIVSAAQLNMPCDAKVEKAVSREGCSTEALLSTGAYDTRGINQIQYEVVVHAQCGSQNSILKYNAFYDTGRKTCTRVELSQQW